MESDELTYQTYGCLPNFRQSQMRKLDTCRHLSFPDPATLQWKSPAASPWEWAKTERSVSATCFRHAGGGKYQASVKFSQTLSQPPANHHFHSSHAVEAWMVAPPRSRSDATRGHQGPPGAPCDVPDLKGAPPCPLP